MITSFKFNFSDEKKIAVGPVFSKPNDRVATFGNVAAAWYSVATEYNQSISLGPRALEEEILAYDT